MHATAKYSVADFTDAAPAAAALDGAEVQTGAGTVRMLADDDPEYIGIGDLEPDEQ